MGVSHRSKPQNSRYFPKFSETLWKPERFNSIEKLLSKGGLAKPKNSLSRQVVGMPAKGPWALQRADFWTIAVQVVCWLMIRMFNCLVSCQGYFARPYDRTVGRANIVTSQITTDRVMG